MKITDTPAVVFLTAVATAFVMGGGALLWLDGHIDGKVAVAKAQLIEMINEKKQGRPSLPVPAGTPGKAVSARPVPTISVHDGGTEADNGVDGHFLVGQAMVQWGVTKSIPATYASQTFSPPFLAPPTVVCSADGAHLNDVSCNVYAVTKKDFQFIVSSASKSWQVGERPLHWMAAGRIHK